MPLCGTDMEFDEFRTGGVPVPMNRALPTSPEIEGLEVPAFETFDALVEGLRIRTADEILAILSNAEAEERYGSPVHTIRTVASELEETDPDLAHSLYAGVWEKFGDSAALPCLVRTSIRAGKISEAFRFARIARYFGEPCDPYLLVSVLEFQNASEFLESVLAWAITQDPNRVPYLSDSETAKFLDGSRKYDEERLDGVDSRSKDAWDVRLRGLEYRGLTLLDPVSANAYVRALLSLAEESADFEGDAREYLAEHAASTPSMVAEAFHSAVHGGDIAGEDCSSVASMLARRLNHVSEHFSDPRFIELHRSMEALFTALDHPESAHQASANVADLTKEGKFHASMPDSVRNFRKRLLAEISNAQGSAFYPRLRSWTISARRPFSFENHGIGALLLFDMLAKEGVPPQDATDLSKRLWDLPVIPEVASMIAFAFAGRSRYQDAAEWLSRSNLEEADNSSLLLRIVSNFREHSDIAIKALQSGAPAAAPSASLAIARVRTLVKNLPAGVANEMLGDAEAAFGNPFNAIEHYANAIDAGNAEALEKAADLCYALGRFEEAYEKYEVLFLLDDFCGAAKLCVSACEKGDTEAAAKYYAAIDAEDPSNAAAVAGYHLVTDDLFGGLALLSAYPSEAAAGIPENWQDEYRAYADAVLVDVPEDGKIESEPDIEALPERLLALRANAHSFQMGVSHALRYAEFVDSALKTSEDGPSEYEVDVAIIGFLAPIHDESAFGYANATDDELRADAMVQLLIDDMKTLAETYSDEALGNGVARREYSSFLIKASEMFARFDEEASLFFRNAAADAIFRNSKHQDLMSYAKSTLH